ncbi:MAG: chromosome segregation protein, partial [Pseudohongiellaceae bacterium]
NDLLTGIYTAANLTEALGARMSLGAKESIITADGLWLGKSWIQISNLSEQDSIIERRGLIADLFRNVKQRTEAAEQLVEMQSSLKTQLNNDEIARDQLQTKLSETTTQLGEKKSAISAQLAKIEEARTRKQRIAHELDELSRQLEIEQQNIAESRFRLQTALDSMEEDVGARENLEQSRGQAKEQLENSRQKARVNKDRSHELALKKQSIESQLHSTRETMDRMASQVQRSKERIESLTTQIDVSDDPLVAMRRDLEELLAKRLDVEAELSAAKSAVDANEHKLRELERSRNAVQQRSSEFREALMQQRLKTEGASVKREGILNQLTDAEFELTDVIAQLPEDVDQAQCEEALEKLGNRIQRLGPINLAAIDEYQQQSERKIYLDKQNDDLENALDTLTNAIKKIDVETRTRFKETFDKINAGLQSLFPKVFGGGHAYLDMTGEDLLDTGVAIMARPPGKRNSTIHLLSGGEKAMTAIALVFSIFQLNPSPFCMLDEVDAPLDDANVGRYASLVKEMSATVQFIFITHNKITMEMANQLLGVTMHEAGVSRIVAVDIEEAAELAAM